MDIAALGLKIESGSAVSASVNLDRMALAAKRAEIWGDQLANTNVKTATTAQQVAGAAARAAIAQNSHSRASKAGATAMAALNTNLMALTVAQVANSDALITNTAAQAANDNAKRRTTVSGRAMISTHQKTNMIILAGAAAIYAMTSEIDKSTKVQVKFGDVSKAVFQVSLKYLGKLLKSYGVTWDDIKAGVKSIGNFMIATFVAAFDATVIAWNAFPDVFKEMWIDLENWLRKKVNSMAEIVGSIPLIGQKLIGGFDKYEMMDNPYSGTKERAAKDINRATEEAYSTDYLGGFYDDVRGQAIKNAVGRKKGSTKKSDYQKEIERMEERTRALQFEASTLTLSAEANRERSNFVKYGIETDYSATLALSKLKQEQELVNAAMASGRDITPALAGNIENLASKYANAEVNLARMKDAQQRSMDLMEESRGVFNGFFGDLRNGLKEGESFWDSFKNAGLNALNKLLDKAMELATNNMFSSLFGGGQMGSSGGGFFSSLLGQNTNVFGGEFSVGAPTNLLAGTRANGGPVQAGLPYLVGERGPEIVIPNASATVVPNHQLPRNITGGQSSANNNGGGNVSNTYVSVKTDPSLEVKETRRRTSSGDYIDISVARVLNRGRATKGAMGSYGLSQRSEQR